MLPIKAWLKLQLKLVYPKARDVPMILTDAGLVNCEVSVDGSWQKRGHSLINGVVTAVSDGKCPDVHVLSKHCKRCTIWEQKRTDLNMKNVKPPISVI